VSGKESANATGPDNGNSLDIHVPSLQQLSPRDANQ